MKNIDRNPKLRKILNVSFATGIFLWSLLLADIAGVFFNQMILKTTKLHTVISQVMKEFFKRGVEKTSDPPVIPSSAESLEDITGEYVHESDNERRINVYDALLTFKSMPDENEEDFGILELIQMRLNFRITQMRTKKSIILNLKTN